MGLWSQNISAFLRWLIHLWDWWHLFITKGHMCISLEDAQGCTLFSEAIFYWNLLTSCQMLAMPWAWGGWEMGEKRREEGRGRENENKRERENANFCVFICLVFSEYVSISSIFSGYKYLDENQKFKKYIWKIFKTEISRNCLR